MRFGKLEGRLVLAGSTCLDVAADSHGRFGADPRAIYSRWAEFQPGPLRPRPDSTED